MKPRRALLFTITIVLALCAACGLWLHRERQQYALNRQLINALERGEANRALVLVNAGADPNTRQEPPPVPSLKLLFHQLLYRSPFPVNESPTAFMFACGTRWNPPVEGPGFSLSFNENLPLLQAMLAHQANVYARGVGNLTSLHEAADIGRLHTVELLLQHGAEVNARDEWGQTPLILTANHADTNIERLLLSHGANPNAQDRYGDTVLHKNIYSPFAADVIPVLMAHGADPYLRNKSNESPLLLAEHVKNPNLLRLLKQYGAK